jgi:hypothetical protein
MPILLKLLVEVPTSHSKLKAKIMFLPFEIVGGSFSSPLQINKYNNNSQIILLYLWY